MPSTQARPLPSATVSPAVRETPRKPKSSLASGPVAGSAYVVVQAGTSLIAGTEGAVLVSVAGGARWRTMNDGLPPDPSVLALAADSTGRRLFALVSGGVYSAALSPPLRWRGWGGALPRGSNAEALAYWPPTHMVLVGDGSGALSGSSGPARPWVPADAGMPVGRAAIATLLSAPGVLYAGLSSGLAYSADGRHWTVDANLNHPVSGLAVLPDGGLAVALDTDGVAVRGGPSAPWRILAPDALGLRPGSRVLSVAYDPRRRRLLVGTLLDGVRALTGLGPPATRLPGVPDDDPVNGLTLSGPWLFAATNAGVIRLTAV